jgi:hypothetical protein
MFLLLALPLSSFTAESDAEQPQWKVGDKWHYKSTQLEGTQDISVEVTEITNVNVNNIDYDVYVVETKSNFTFQGVTLITGINSYILRSNLAKVKNEFTETVSQNTSIVMTTTYNPPRKDYDFPLKVGKTWYSESTESFFDGETYNNISRRLDYSVVELESLTLEAGTFECYKIKIDDGLGSIYYDWYSPKVSNTVNATLRLDLFLPLELTSSTFTDHEDGNSKPGDTSNVETPYLLLLISVIVAVILVVIVVLKKKDAKKKKRKKEEGSKKKKKKSAKKETVKKKGKKKK